MNEHCYAAVITVTSHSNPNAGWSWFCTCAVSDQKRRVDKSSAVASARLHGNKKHSRYGFVLKPEYQ